MDRLRRAGLFATKGADAKAKPGRRGLDALSGTDPFIMKAGRQGLAVRPDGLVDGPLPTHYEPAESPVKNPLYKQQTSPVLKYWKDTDNRSPQLGDPKYPYVITTYRLTEHYLAGRHEPLAAVADRAAAGAVRRDEPRAGAGEGHRESRLGQGLHAARRDPRQGAGHPAHAPVHDRRQSRPPGRHAVALGLRGPGHRRRRQRADVAGRRSERVDPRGKAFVCNVEKA